MISRNAIVVCRVTACIRHGHALVLVITSIAMVPGEVFAVRPLPASPGTGIPAPHIPCHLHTNPALGVLVGSRTGKINL